MENNNLPLLCESNVCTGCSSCAQSCNQSAISMVLNEEGYYNPQVDTDKCIGCLVCEKHCPIFHPVSKHSHPLNTYSAWIKNVNDRELSSSGGAFTAIALSVLKLNGVVWGAGYDENVHPKYMFIERAEDLDILRGSKYVQCEIGNSYRTIKSQLKEGRKVLFCGTPCHVAGLYSYLNNQLTDNLLTVDFICHGVPSSKLFANYIKWLEEKFNDKVIDYNFRDSRFGINYNVGTSVLFEKAGKKNLCFSYNSYTYGFCQNKTIHKSCDLCKFREISRHSDFTIGDYHGAKGEYGPLDQYNGISCVISNSPKADSLLDSLDIYKKNIPLERIVKSNPSYSKQTLVESSFDLRNLLNEPYDIVQKKYFRISFKDNVKTIIMLVFGGKFSYIIKNLM